MLLEDKYKKLVTILQDLGSVAIGFSGGVDSTLLAKVCTDVLGPNALAITLRAAIHSKREIRESMELAKDMGISHVVVDADLLETEAFQINPVNRCYLCKQVVFSKIIELAKERGIQYVVDGSNIDDLKDYRPGAKALKELGIRSPLQEAGLTKDEIRALSRKFSLPTWDKPAFACLASRFPYGMEITQEKLSMVEESENFLLDLGFRQFRVRYHGEVARIEVAPEEREKFFNLPIMDTVSRQLKKYGFQYVTMDLEGYRMGSLNEGLPSK